MEIVRRNVLFQDVHSKGTDPRWSDEVYTVKGSYGNTMLISNNIKYKRDKLLKITPDTVSNETNPITLSKKINKEINQRAKQS